MAQDKFVFEKQKIADEPGIINDVIFLNCYWPAYDQPTRLFLEGSSGIEVMGPPTPRNIVFPEDTVFLNYAGTPTRSDCFFLKEYDENGEALIAELTIEEAILIADNQNLRQGIVESKEFISISDSLTDSSVKKYLIDGTGKVTEKEATGFPVGEEVKP